MRVSKGLAKSIWWSVEGWKAKGMGRKKSEGVLVRQLESANPAKRKEALKGLLAQSRYTNREGIMEALTQLRRRPGGEDEGDKDLKACLIDKMDEQSAIRNLGSEEKEKAVAALRELCGAEALWNREDIMDALVNIRQKPYGRDREVEVLKTRLLNRLDQHDVTVPPYLTHVGVDNRTLKEIFGS